MAFWGRARVQVQQMRPNGNVRGGVVGKPPAHVSDSISLSLAESLDARTVTHPSSHPSVHPSARPSPPTPPPHSIQVPLFQLKRHEIHNWAQLRRVSCRRAVRSGSAVFPKPQDAWSEPCTSLLICWAAVTKSFTQGKVQTADMYFPQF